LQALLEPVENNQPARGKAEGGFAFGKYARSDILPHNPCDVLPFQAALPHENLPFSSSSRFFPTTLLWSFLQDLDLAHLLWNRRSTWGRITRKRKIAHEASLHLAVASARNSHDARFQGREEWNGR